MQRLLLLIYSLLFIVYLNGQNRPPHPELENPSIQGINKEYPHASFISYEDRETAILNDKSKSSRLISLDGIWKSNIFKGVSVCIKEFSKKLNDQVLQNSFVAKEKYSIGQSHKKHMFILT